MRTCDPFRFWTNEIPLANVFRELCFRRMLACVMCALSITVNFRPASAMFQPPGTPNSEVDRASNEAREECLQASGGTDDCPGIVVWVDPRAIDVNRFRLELLFDSTRFKFNMSKSGPLGIFADGGEPFRSHPVGLGKEIPIPVDNPPSLPGNPPPGFTLCFSEPTNGDLIVDYAIPTRVDLSENQIVFQLAFDFMKPIPAAARVFVTYFETAGHHDFNQVAFSCNNGESKCLGQPPVFGFDIRIENLQ